MNTEKEKKLPGISRQDEERYLTQTLAVIHDNIEIYGHDVARMRNEIDELLNHFHDDNPELINALENTITLHDHMKRALERNMRARNKPYFGRIIFHDESLDKEESLYIGRSGINKDATHLMVVDWRAPVANAYYENGLGKCAYPSPTGKDIPIELELKRTYEIENGKLNSLFDSEVIANDELLTKYLAKNKQAVLGEIVATIQKEQNEIIRKSPYHNIIVQGVAGSGKTTVAMHRISFILYNYAERFKPDDFYIVGSNRILLNYITGVLPDLDVYGVKQMTMEQLFVRLLYEDWDENKYSMKLNRSGNKGIIKGSLSWFRDLENYCRQLEWNVISRESIYLNPLQFVEGIQDGKPGVFDRTGENPGSLKDMTLLVDGTAVERYILQNPTVSIQSKINMLNERLNHKVKDAFLGKGVKYTEAEKKAISKAYRSRYGANVWKQSIYKIYEDFLEKQIAKGHAIDIPDRDFDVYDLAALAYLYKRVKETDEISEAHHVVIDEAQDFGMMAYSVLKFCIKDCTYTIMGDVSQNIHFGYGLNDWEELRKLYLDGDSMASFGILKKSYRNTVEISDFATNILHHGQFSSYPIEPIIRHGNPVTVKQLTSRKSLIKEAADTCKNWQEKGLDTIAVICRNQEEATRIAQELGQLVDLMESDLEKAEFGNGILILPVEYTKGLEFDGVLILDPTRKEYPVDDGHAKLLYVAATRALHELCVLHEGNLTGLIADPIPKRIAEKNDTTSSLNKDDLHDKVSTQNNVVLQSNEVRQHNNISQRNTISSNKNIIINRPKENIPPTPARPKATITIASPTTTSKTPALQTNYTGKGNTQPIINHQKKAPISSALNKSSGISFGDMPISEVLKPVGHTKIDLGIRWVSKQKDGLYLQSRYGILALSPIGSGIIRVTFVKGSKLEAGVHDKIAAKRTDRKWMYKESSKLVELFTDELCLQVDKVTGAIRYLTRDKKLLLQERPKECRQQESTPGKPTRNWLYLDFQKGENIYALGTKGIAGINLRGTARYISHGENATELPLLLSDRGYGILVASEGPALCCDIPTYGSFLYTERNVQMDYYFIAGQKTNTILSAYAYLTGKI